MKFAYSLWIFSLLCYATDAMGNADANACMNRTYQPYDQSYEKQTEIIRKFDWEYYSFILSGIQKLFCVGKPKIQSQKEKDNARLLCACAILKYQGKDGTYEEFDKIFKTTVAKAIGMKFPISYYITTITHTFPAYSCQFNNETYIIAKGSKKRSSKREIYNIYVGVIRTNKDKTKDNDLKGVIENVDVEMPVFGDSQKVPASETSENQQI